MDTEILNTLSEIANRDSAVSVTVRAEHLRQALNYISRLTHERDGLLAEVDRLDLKVSEYDYASDSQQSELTKAWELLGEVRIGCDSSYVQMIDTYLTTHQSAPAGKGE